ncbi:protein of unknown function [Burkholderia multivorans]
MWCGDKKCRQRRAWRLAGRAAGRSDATRRRSDARLPAGLRAGSSEGTQVADGSHNRLIMPRVILNPAEKGPARERDRPAYRRRTPARGR